MSIWVTLSSAIVASDPSDKEEMFEPTGSKIYRHRFTRFLTTLGTW